MHTNQYSLVAQSSLTLCNPMLCSTPGFPVLHQLLELAQTHVHWVSDAIQPPYPLSSPFPPACKLSQHQDLFQWVSSLHQVAKVLEFQLFILKSRDITLLPKVHLVKAMIFPIVMYVWVLKNWCFWTVVLEKTLESPLDCKEIKPVSPKGNQSWIFIDAKAETEFQWIGLGWDEMRMRWEGPQGRREKTLMEHVLESGIDVVFICGFLSLFIYSHISICWAPVLSQALCSALGVQSWLRHKSTYLLS